MLGRRDGSGPEVGRTGKRLSQWSQQEMMKVWAEGEMLETGEEDRVLRTFQNYQEDSQGE